MRKATVTSEVHDVPIFVTDARAFAELHAGPRGYIHTLDVDLGRVFDGVNLYDASTRWWPPAYDDLTEEGRDLWDSIADGTVFGNATEDDYEIGQYLAAVLTNNWDAIEDPSFLRWLHKHGYDSTRIRGEHEGNHFAVFDPKRIRIIDVESREDPVRNLARRLANP